MPCYDPPPSYSELAEHNFHKYGVRCTYEEMVKAIACEAMSAMEHEGILSKMAPYAQKWFAQHKMDDTLRKVRQQQSGWLGQRHMKSFNKSQHDWEARHKGRPIRTVTPALLQALYGPTEEDDVQDALVSREAGMPEETRRDRALEEAYLRLFGKVPRDENERYAAEAAIEHVPVLTGRGED